MIHQLKIDPCYFDAILYFHKRFEIRFNDRDFQLFDTLILSEFDSDKEIYSGRRIFCSVTYILRSCKYLMPGYVALGFVISEVNI